jgi:nitroreductase
MKAIDCIKTRRSVRSYKDKKIPNDIIEDIMECANLAPSAMARYPWRFVVVTNKDKMAKMADAATHGKFISGAAACIIVAGKKGNEHTIKDCCAATQNILLAAWSCNIGSCWVNAWRRDYCTEIAELIGLPGDFELVALVPLGYPAESPKAHNRPLSEVLHWERFQK